MQDSYFTGGTAAELMGTLAARPDSILVSAETVTDYQLTAGDTVKLRLVDAHTHRPITVPFRFAGVVNEFPTAPRDSFFVANAAYIAQRTGSDAVGAFLIDTGGQDSAAVAARISTLISGSAAVSDISTTRQVVGSSLTAVDLSGLTRVELGFAFLLAAATGGLVLALGVAERRRSFAIATALGARPRHLRAIIGSDAAVLAVTGLAAGAVIGWVLSRLLVSVLTGVFDPPPASMAVPWPYLGALTAVTVLALAGVTAAAARVTSIAAIGILREL
jgi:putative ABC transport system permease protein